MIIHTLVSNSCFFSEDESNSKAINIQDMSLQSGKLTVCDGKIKAIFSTNPKDFLNYRIGDKFLD